MKHAARRNNRGRTQGNTVGGDEGKGEGGGSMPLSRRGGGSSTRGKTLHKSAGAEGRGGGENASGRRGTNNRREWHCGRHQLSGNSQEEGKEDLETTSTGESGEQAGARGQDNGNISSHWCGNVSCLLLFRGGEEDKH